jgi:hypothetical protein
MPNIAAPRGFLPVGNLAGRPVSGAARAYRITSGYATSIYTGDIVTFVTAGVINAPTFSSGQNSSQFRGVFAGAQWVGTDGIPVVKPYWPASTAVLGGTYAQGWVYDDPDMVYEAQYANSTTAPNVTDLGASMNTYNTGNASTFLGLSGEGLDYTTLNTTLQQWRILDFVQRADNDITSAYVRALVVPLNHDFKTQSAV